MKHLVRVLPRGEAVLPLLLFAPRRIATTAPTLLALFLASALLQNPAQAAGGAFVVDDTDVDNPGDCKVESSASYAFNDPHNDLILVTTPACVVPIFSHPVEMALSLARFRADNHWGTGLTLKGKTTILPSDVNTIGLAISGGPAFDFVTGRIAGGFINMPASYQFNDQLRLNVNLGWLYEAPHNLSWLTYGAALEWKITSAFANSFPNPYTQVTLIAEVFGLTGNNPNPDVSTKSSPRGQVGLRFTPKEDLDIDVIYGRNVFGENANWITLGLNIRF